MTNVPLRGRPFLPLPFSGRTFLIVGFAAVPRECWHDRFRKLELRLDFVTIAGLPAAENLFSTCGKKSRNGGACGRVGREKAADVRLPRNMTAYNLSVEQLAFAGMLCTLSLPMT
jgi:hypothetical protein